MAWTYFLKEDGRNWFLIENREQWLEFTKHEANYEPDHYPCLVNERVIRGYCRSISEFYVRYDV